MENGCFFFKTCRCPSHIPLNEVWDFIWCDKSKVEVRPLMVVAVVLSRFKQKQVGVSLLNLDLINKSWTMMNLTFFRGMSCLFQRLMPCPFVCSFLGGAALVETDDSVSIRSLLSCIQFIFDV